MASFFLCFAAWTALALGMDRHHADALGSAGSAVQQRWWQCTGWLVLLLSMWWAVLAPAHAPPLPPASMAAAAWTVALSAAAIAASAALTWRPRRAPLLGAAALLAGLLAHAISL